MRLLVQVLERDRVGKQAIERRDALVPHIFGEAETYRSQASEGLDHGRMFGRMGKGFAHDCPPGFARTAACRSRITAEAGSRSDWTKVSAAAFVPRRAAGPLRYSRREGGQHHRPIDTRQPV